MGKNTGQATLPSLLLQVVVTMGLSPGAKSQPMTALELPDHMIKWARPGMAALAIHAMAAFALGRRSCSKLDIEMIDARERPQGDVPLRPLGSGLRQRPGNYRRWARIWTRRRAGGSPGNRCSYSCHGSPGTRRRHLADQYTV